MLQFEQHYRFKRTPLSDDELNRRFRHVDVRLHGLEDKIIQFDQSVDALVQRGLNQINTQLSATIDAINAEVDGVQELVEGLEQLIGSLEQQIDDIIAGGTLPANSITVSAIGGMSATNAQAALAELRTQVAVLESAVSGIGDVIVVADLTAAAALTGLDVGDLVHVLNNGSSKWVRYQVTSAGDGTWGGATKVSIWTQDQAPATHQHVIGDVTGLQTTLDGKAEGIRSITASGLATGGGDLTANRTIAVAAATEAEIRTGTAAKAVSVEKAYASLAEVTIANIAAWDTSAGTNFNYTLMANVTLNASTFVVGKSGRIRFQQDATGGRTLAFDAADFVFSDDTPPDINAAANSETLIWYDVIGAARIFISSGAQI